MARETMSTDDFFRSRLEQMINLRHPLAVLAKRMPWAQIEAALAPVFAHKSRPGKVIEEENLFGTSLEIAAAVPSAAGRPRLPIRLIGFLALLEARLQCE
jgi:IS5 family transposase